MKDTNPDIPLNTTFEILSRILDVQSIVAQAKANRYGQTKVNLLKQPPAKVSAAADEDVCLKVHIIGVEPEKGFGSRFFSKFIFKLFSKLFFGIFFWNFFFREIL